MFRRGRFHRVPSRIGTGRRSARRRPASALFPLSRRLSIELLEDRRLLANVTVGNLNDVVNGTTTSIAALIATPGADGISLREAVLAANADNTDASDTIGFSVTGIIPLTNVGHVGEIVINNDLTINGPGDKLLTIKAFDPDADGTNDGDGARIFNVDDGTGTVRTVAISGLTLTGGDVASILGGGAISNRETLTLTALTITGNSAGSTTTGFHGGGIVNNGGNLTVQASTISGNNVLFGRGGGIYSTFGTMTISQSTFFNNSVSSTGSGGGVYSNYTTTTIDSSTISNNRANVGGGAVQVGIGRLMTITNSTISENEARLNGGGVVALFGDVSLRHSTITLNRADDDLNGTGNGGGVFVNSVLSNATLNHTIVAGNTRGSSTPVTRDDIFGAVVASSAFNLVGVNTGMTGISHGTNGNQVGTGASPIDAMLAPGGAQPNGGPTGTHMLLAGSPAIDAGDPSFAAPPANDQRGSPFVRVFDGDGAGGARIDIGAYERQTLAPSSFVVDTLVDELDGNYLPGDISLREAMSAANGSPGANTISFAAALTAGGPATIVLKMGYVSMSESATITGPGAGLLTIDASGSDPTPAINNGDGSRVIRINLENTGNAVAAISGLTLTGGDIAEPNGYAIGGAIYNSDKLTLTGCVIRDNSADHGGGIGNRFAELEMIDCTVSGNSGREFGGGIYSAASDTTIRSSTISGNSAVGSGGGIAGGSPLIIYDSTISGNSAKYGGGIYGRPTAINCTIDGNMAHDGGGIYNLGTGTITIENSSLSGNTVVDSGGGIYSRLAAINISDSTLNNNTSNFDGGAIASESGPITIVDSTLSGNEAHFGGAISAQGSTFSLSGSTIHDNQAYFGGGIYASVDNPTITNSTISGNRALFDGTVDGAGGGIDFGGVLATIRNSTISGNSASGDGGGIRVSLGSQVSLQHSTVTGNTADVDATGGGRGGGIHHTSGPGFLIGTLLDHTIVAGNSRYGGGRDDLFGGVQARDSLIGDNTGISTFTNLGGNLIGTAAVPINPLLGSLADNGGRTKTHALLPGSPAIDSGNQFAAPGVGDVPLFDQRGSLFIRVFDGDGMNGARIDMGAYEVQTVANLTLVVDTLVDESDGNYSAGDMSLREAIGLANGSTGANTITFAAALTSGGPATILLKLGEFQVRDTLVLPGPGATKLTIDASGNDPTPDVNNGDGSRIFDVDDDVFVGAPMVFTISGFTLTGGDHVQEGGAIQSQEDVVISNCVIIGNAAANGGGILMDTGDLTMTSCIVMGNTAEDDGGGIYVDDGTSIITASVIQGNSAGENGGGIVNFEKLEVVATTISGNSAETGGGLFNGTVLANPDFTKITNSTISGNAATIRGGGVYNDRGLTSIRFSTITDNVAPAGMGSGVGSHGDSLTRTEVNSSIIAGNDNSDVDFVSGGANSFDSNGFNVVGSGNATMSPLNAFNQTGDQVGANPLLGPLADNGGPTKTHALLAGSPAINLGDPAFAPPPANDQRGAPFARVSGGRIDIGALERQPIPPAVFGDYNQNGVVDTADYVVWRKTLGATVVQAYSGADGDGDGVIDNDDYGVWRAHFGQTVPAAGAGGGGIDGETGRQGDKESGSTVENGIVQDALAEPVAPNAESPHPLATDAAHRYPSRPLPEGKVEDESPAKPGTDESFVASATRNESRSVRARQDAAAMSKSSRQDAGAIFVARRDDALAAWFAGLTRDDGAQEYRDPDIDAGDEPSDDSAESFGEAVDAVFERVFVEF